MPTDIEIAHSVEPWPITQVAEAAGVDAKADNTVHPVSFFHS